MWGLGGSSPNTYSRCSACIIKYCYNNGFVHDHPLAVHLDIHSYFAQTMMRSFLLRANLISIVEGGLGVKNRVTPTSVKPGILVVELSIITQTKVGMIPFLASTLLLARIAYADTAFDCQPNVNGKQYNLLWVRQTRPSVFNTLKNGRLLKI